MAEKSVGDKETWMWFSQQWLKLAQHPRGMWQTSPASTTLANPPPSTESIPSQFDGALGRPQRRRRGQSGARNRSGKAKTPACDALRVAPKQIEGDRGNGPGRCERGDRGHDRTVLSKAALNLVAHPRLRIELPEAVLRRGAGPNCASKCPISMKTRWCPPAVR